MPISSILPTGRTTGHLSFESTGMMIAADILLFHPEIQKQLDEIEEQGWEYLFSETSATSFAELDLSRSEYNIRNINAIIDMEELMMPEEKLLEVRIGTEMPKVTSVGEVSKFTIVVSDKDAKRAATVDLVTKVVVSLGEQFWNWDRKWGTDEEKVSEARSVLKIATWFLKTKGYTLSSGLSKSHYDELVKLFNM